MSNDVRNWAIAGALVCGLGFGGSAAAQNYLAPGTLNTLSDDYGERLYDADLSGGASAGDVLIGVVGITSNLPNNNLSTASLPQITAIFANTIASFDAVTGQAVLRPTTAAEMAAAAASFGGTTLAGGAALTTLPGLSVNGLTGAVVWVYEDTPPLSTFFPLTSHTTFQDGVNRATDGNFILSMGFDGSANEAMVAAVSPAIVTGFAFRMTVLQENLPDIVDFGLLPIHGTEIFMNGSIDQANTRCISFPCANAYQISGDATVQLIPIPEPATLLIFGAGLLGLGLVVRRRRRDA